MHKICSIYPGITKDVFIQCLNDDKKVFKEEFKQIKYKQEIILQEDANPVGRTKSTVDVRVKFSDGRSIRDEHYFSTQTFVFSRLDMMEASAFAEIMAKHYSAHYAGETESLAGIKGENYLSSDLKLKVWCCENVVQVFCK